MKEQRQFINEVSEQIDISFNQDQLNALSEIYRFLFTGGSKSIFILKGYAGTGKTTLMGALIRWLHSVNRKTVLLAPTGRSAKVLTAHSGYGASTIHRRIYSVKQDLDGRMHIDLVQNRSERTIFIVDEASMIPDGSSGRSDQRSLLHDLIRYVYMADRCRLILIGDNAQLPPVGFDESPALDANCIKKITNDLVFGSELTTVVRQAIESRILYNATRLRNYIRTKRYGDLSLRVAQESDVILTEMEDLEDELMQCFNQDETRSILITRSNKDAFQFNMQIRVRIYDRTSEIESGDRIMVVKNNYFWKIPGRGQNFLANGDMLYVEKVISACEFGPFRFAECNVRLVGEEGEPFYLIVLLNSLEFEGPAIPSKQLLKLRDEMISDGVLDSAEAYEKFFQNPYFNAAQIKYAYAITCHKSQGGQWRDVFIYQGYLTQDMLNLGFYRWLYTAVTRATEKLHLIGFHPSFLESD